MGKSFWTFLIALFIISCNSKLPDNWKEIDLGQFKISTPKLWNFQDPGKPGDSFAGYIIGPDITLFFDCSNMGYANHLLPTEQEYLEDFETYREYKEDIKKHNFYVYSNGKYVFKTIWPKVAGKGMTGVYIHSRTTDFNFQMSGENLSAENQKLALEAFKTITFK